MVGCAVVVPVDAGLLNAVFCKVAALPETVWLDATLGAETGGCCFFLRFSL